jgi:hypothetical protein
MTGTFEGLKTLQFSPDNKYAQIMSGETETPASTDDTTLLEFTTEGYYLVAKFLFSYSDPFDSDNMEHGILFNDLRVFSYGVTGATTYTEPDNTVPLIIPPYTNVKMNTKNYSGNARTIYNLMVAKVKGTIEQIDLEAVTDGSKWAL